MLQVDYEQRPCSSPQRPQVPSCQLQLGMPAQLTQGVGGAPKSRSRRRRAAVETSRSIAERMRPRGGGGPGRVTVGAGDHGNVS